MKPRKPRRFLGEEKKNAFTFYLQSFVSHWRLVMGWGKKKDKDKEKKVCHSCAIIMSSNHHYALLPITLL